MITEDQERQIHDEERLRIAVREELENQHGRKAMSIWRFLNTPFLVAMIPSIALALTPVIFSKVEADREEARYIKRIDTEILRRVDVAFRELKRMAAQGWTDDFIKANNFHSNLNEIFTHKNIRFIDPAFQKWSIKMLLTERMMLYPDSKEPNMSAALQSLNCIEDHLAEFAAIPQHKRLKEPQKELFNNTYGGLVKGFSHWFPAGAEKDRSRSCSS